MDPERESEEEGTVTGRYKTRSRSKKVDNITSSKTRVRIAGGEKVIEGDSKATEVVKDEKLATQKRSRKRKTEEKDGKPAQKRARGDSVDKSSTEKQVKEEEVKADVNDKDDETKARVKQEANSGSRKKNKKNGEVSYCVFSDKSQYVVTIFHSYVVVCIVLLFI